MKRITISDISEKFLQSQFSMNSKVHTIVGVLSIPTFGGVAGVKTNCDGKDSMIEINKFNEMVNSNEIKFIDVSAGAANG